MLHALHARCRKDTGTDLVSMELGQGAQPRACTSAEPPVVRYLLPDNHRHSNGTTRGTTLIYCFCCTYFLLTPRK